MRQTTFGKLNDKVDLRSTRLASALGIETFYRASTGSPINSSDFLGSLSRTNIVGKLSSVAFILTISRSSNGSIGRPLVALEKNNLKCNIGSVPQPMILGIG